MARALVSAYIGTRHFPIFIDVNCVVFDARDTDLCRQLKYTALKRIILAHK